MKKMVLAIILIFSLSSCASVPNEVEEDMSSYRNTNHSQTDFDFQFINTADLNDNAVIALSKQYNQFSISDKICFSQPNEINIMEFKHINNFINKAENIMSFFYTNPILASQEITSDSNTFAFFNENEKLYGRVENDGFIAMLKPDAFDISFSYSEPNIKIYHPNRNENLSDEYQLKNGKCSIENAIEYIDNWFENNYSQFSPEFEYKVNTVIVREHEGNYLYQFLIEAIYEGVSLDSYTREAEINNGELTGKMSYIDYGIQIQMVNIYEIDSFTNLMGIVTPSIKENVSKCISLESALSYCENTFSDFKDVIISDIDIMYTLEPVYEFSDEGVPYIVSYNSRPVWEMIIDVPPENFLAAGETNTYGDVRKYIYIDMITGELKYNFDTVKQGIGG